MNNVKNIFVSVCGNDSYDGTIEKPLRTIKAAQLKCRKLLKDKQSVTVYLREGDYFEKLSFDKNDSAQDGFLVTYKAYGNEKARIVGGKKLTNITKTVDEEVLSRLKGSVQGKVYEFILSDYGINKVDDFSPYTIPNSNKPAEISDVRIIKNGEIMYPARYPNNNEFVRIEEIISQDTYTNGDRVIDNTKTKPAVVKVTCEEMKNWKELDDIWMYGFPSFDWSSHFCKVQSIDAENEIVTLPQPLLFAVRPGQRLSFVNILEELDCEDEFFIDRKNGKVYIISENPESDNFEIALSPDKLITVDGTENITFENITFSLCRSEVVTIENSKNINIIGCSFLSNLRSAVTVNNCYNCEIKGNRIANMGGAGISVNCGDRANFIESGVKITNNEIHDFAQILEMYQCALHIDGYGNYIAHNEIYNAIQCAVKFSGNCNIFEYNEIHDCLKRTADAGSCFSGRTWLYAGNVFRYNYFHDFHMSTRETHTTKGIYLDDMMLGTEIYSNIFENVQSGVYSHGGRMATVKNNIFINCKKHSVRFFPCTHAPCPGFVDDFLLNPAKKWIEENPKWAEKFPEVEETLNDPLRVFPMYNKVIGNIIFNSPDPSIEYGAFHTTENRDNISTNDESIFVDYKNRNFAIKDIEKLKEQIPGFDAPDFSKIGLLK